MRWIMSAVAVGVVLPFVVAFDAGSPRMEKGAALASSSRFLFPNTPRRTGQWPDMLTREASRQNRQFDS